MCSTCTASWSISCGADEARARDLQDAWCDPSVDAVICARGGYGAHRMVDLVDWAAMRAAGPKVFVGYSDITVLHEAFALRTGLATLHGPMVGTETFLKDPRTQDSLRSTLFEPETVMTLGLDDARALVPGRARGVTYGGCVSLLAADLATPHGRTSARGGLLVIEDTTEDPYSIDRILTQLLRVRRARRRGRGGLRFLGGLRTVRAGPRGARRPARPAGRARRRGARIRTRPHRADDSARGARRAGRTGGRRPGHPHGRGRRRWPERIRTRRWPRHCAGAIAVSDSVRRGPERGRDAKKLNNLQETLP